MTGEPTAFAIRSAFQGRIRAVLLYFALCAHRFNAGCMPRVDTQARTKIASSCEIIFVVRV